MALWHFSQTTLRGEESAVFTHPNIDQGAL